MADPFLVSAPDVEGVPPILRPAGYLDAVDLLTTSLDTVGDANEAWGIYAGGTAVVTADGVVGFEYRGESTLSNYPVESGKLETFDKVAQPYEARVRFVAGIDAANRSNMLASVEAIAGDLQLYDVVTPERVYLNANVTRYSYQRTNESGVGLLAVDVWLQEVRVATSSGDVSNTAQPSGADPVDGGIVQAQPVTTPQPFLPDDVMAGGGGALAAYGVKALGRIEFATLDALLAEMMTCMSIREPALTRPLTGDDVEEIATLLLLRREWFGVHFDFLLSAARSLMPPGRMTAGAMAPSP